MLDGKKNVEIALEELRWEEARQHAGRIGNRANSFRKASLGEAIQHAGRRGNRRNSLGGASRERDSMLDGWDTLEIACGKLRREGARQHGTERHSMLDGEETVEIACGELRWEGARHSIQAVEMAWGELTAELLVQLFQSCWHSFFRTNVIIAIALKNCGRKTGQTVPRPVKRFPKAEKWDMHGKTFVAAAGFVLHETVEKVAGICRAVGTSVSGQIAATRLS